MTPSKASSQPSGNSSPTQSAKLVGFVNLQRTKQNANDVLFIMVLSLSLPLHLLEIGSLLQFHRGVWICRCLFASLSLSRMECCHVYTIYYMQIVLIFTSPARISTRRRNSGSATITYWNWKGIPMYLSKLGIARTRVE